MIPTMLAAYPRKTCPWRVLQDANYVFDIVEWVVLKHRYGALTDDPRETVTLLQEAIENGERVVILHD